MATLFEYYNTGDDGLGTLYGVNWEGQTFLTTGAYTATSVKVKLMRLGSPGTVTFSIRATSGGQMVGSDLAVGTTNGNTLTTDSGGEWREITFSSGVSLDSGTLYGIAGRVLGGDGSNYAQWRVDQSSPTYFDGMVLVSSNNGVDWTDGAGYDHMFEMWGDAATALPLYSSPMALMVQAGLI